MNAQNEKNQNTISLVENASSTNSKENDIMTLLEKTIKEKKVDVNLFKQMNKNNEELKDKEKIKSIEEELTKLLNEKILGKDLGEETKKEYFDLLKQIENRNRNRNKVNENKDDQEIEKKQDQDKKIDQEQKQDQDQKQEKEKEVDVKKDEKQNTECEKQTENNSPPKDTIDNNTNTESKNVISCIDKDNAPESSPVEKLKPEPSNIKNIPHSQSSKNEKEILCKKLNDKIISKNVKLPENSEIQKKLKKLQQDSINIE